MKVTKLILKSLTGLVVLVVVFFLGFVGVAQILEFRPALSLPLENLGASPEEPLPAPPRELSLLSWNLGYGGLDRETDFILEGGKLSRARNPQAVRNNLTRFLEVLKEHPADIFFLQEVDRESSRSFKVDQVISLIRAFPEYAAWYGVNYHVFFVPVPPAMPIGKVHSGLMSLSRFPATTAVRIQLPGYYSWPVRLFHLKRCMMVIHFPSPVPNRDWYLIQLHLSAYDQDGTLRKRQLDFVKDYLLKLARQGHYIIAGGDWNSLFPGLNMNSFGAYSTAEESLFWVQSIPAEWTPPGWTWVFDPSVATCRSLEQPYIPGENFITIIDGFLISPGLETVEVQALDLEFRHSDHNPLQIRLKIKE